MVWVCFGEIEIIINNRTCHRFVMKLCSLLYHVKEMIKMFTVLVSVVQR